MKRYTEDEDKLILSYLEDNPDNLKKAFAELAQQLGRTPTGIATHWYSTLSRGKHVVFMTIAKKKYSSNRKTGKMQKKTILPSLWKKILTFFGF